MKDLTEVIDLVEGREPGAEGVCVFAPETPALRELKEKAEAAFAFWPGLSDETRARLAEWIERAAEEAGV